MNTILKKISSIFPKSESKNKGRGREVIAKLSKGLMLPIAILPIAGLFLGVGAAITTAATNQGNEALLIFGNFLKIPGDVIFGALPALFAIAIAIAFTKDAGPAALSALVAFLVFGGLQTALIEPVMDLDGTKILGYNLLFYGPGSLGKYSPEITSVVDGVDVVIGAGLNSSLFANVLGINQLSSSVFGGFIVGFTTAFMYNKFKDIQLPAVIGFFSGVRFVPISLFLLFFPITVIFMIIWPLVGILFNILGEGLGSGMLGFNSFIFGYIERALVPFGLHHAFYSPLWYTSVGGELILGENATILINGAQEQISSISVGGKEINITDWRSLFVAINGTESIYAKAGSIAGDQTLWAGTNTVVGTNVELANGSTHTLTFSDFTNANASKGVNVGQYMQGKYPFMMFGLPAAAGAMALAAPKEHRKMSISIVGSAALTSFLTGITEPLEFTFLFLAPWLFWGIHSFFCAFSFGFMNWIGLIIPAAAPHIGMTFSGGAIDWVIYGAIQIPGGSNAWWALLLGVAYIPIYFFVFRWAIIKFNIATPGRGGNEKLFTKEDFKNKGNSNHDFDPLAIQIIDAYGGLENISNVDACMTKLRIQVKDQKIVDEARLKNELGASGTIRPSAHSVYSVYGFKADLYKKEIIDIIKATDKDPNLKNEIFSNINKENSNQTKISKEKSNDVEIIYAPMNCEIIALENVPDSTFSEKMLGDGVAILPLEKDFSSIIKKGKMELVFETNHAYSFATDKGTSIMMHIGIDSIGFKDADGNPTSLFEQKIKTGNPIENLNADIASVNLDWLKEFAASTITPIVVLNETIKGRSIELLVNEGEKVKRGQPIFKIK